MTAPDYNAIDDTELAPGKPITSSLLTRLRDGLLSVIGGGLNAPLIERLAISAGGTGLDGGWVNGTSISGVGYFEPSSIIFTADHSLPAVSVIRCSGDVSMTGAHTITIPQPSEVERICAITQLRATEGDPGGDGVYGSGSSYGIGAGGAMIGNGGTPGSSGGTGSSTDGTAGVGAPVASMRYSWLALNPKLGGHGGRNQKSGDVPGFSGTRGLGGGSLVLLIEGDCDLTNMSIVADGGGSSPSGIDVNPGCGAGGSIIIMCTGTLTGGTFYARGGGSGSVNLATGGGGYVALIASAFAGAQTFSVGHGTDPGSIHLGSDGASEKVTLTAAQIRGLMFRSY